MIKERTIKGKKWWYLYNHAGTKILGKHRTRAGAVKQEQAININKHKRGK